MKDTEHPTLEYYSALGQFMHIFADVEFQMTRVVGICAGLSPEMGKALFSGCRIDDSMTKIRRALQVSKMSRVRKDELERIIKQLKLINMVRNLIAHYGVEGVTQTEGRCLRPTAGYSLNKQRSTLTRFQRRLFGK